MVDKKAGKAHLVAGCRTWEKNFGRHVKHGEHGVRIMVPVYSKKERK